MTAMATPMGLQGIFFLRRAFYAKDWQQALLWQAAGLRPGESRPGPSFSPGRWRASIAQTNPASPPGVNR